MNNGVAYQCDSCGKKLEKAVKRDDEEVYCSSCFKKLEKELKSK